jgi:hypothetical protein
VIEVIDLANTSVTDTRYAAIRKLCRFNTCTRIQRNDPCLVTVNWNGDAADDEDIVRLAEALHRNTHVQKLWLMDNKDTPALVKRVGPALGSSVAKIELEPTGTLSRITNRGVKALHATLLGESAGASAVREVLLHGTRATLTTQLAIATICRLNEETAPGSSARAEGLASLREHELARGGKAS